MRTQVSLAKLDQSPIGAGSEREVTQVSQSLKRTPRTKYVTGTVSGGGTFVEYGVPGGGMVRVMNSEILKKALRQTEGSIRATVERIQRRHGANE
jgi:hypothetical protein